MAQAIRTPRFRGRPVAAGQHITRSDLSDHPRRFRGRHHAATIFVIALLAVVGFRTFPAYPVTVIADGQSFRVNATFDARSEGLAAADVSLLPGDRVLAAVGGSYASVAVTHARPVVVDVDGESVQLRTQASTIGGALAAAGVDLGPRDLVSLDGRLATARGPLSTAMFASARPAAPPAGDPSAPVRVSVVRARPVTVVVDTLRVETSSSAATVEQLLTELGMTVLDGDLVRPGLDAPLNAGMTVRLAKARTISVVLDGKEQALYTLAQTVGDVLALLNVDPGPDDILSLPRDTVVANGMTLVVGLTRTAEEDVSATLAPPISYETDSSLPPGAQRVVPGRDGVRTERFRVTYRNGVESSRVLVSRWTSQEPVATRHISGPAAAGSKPVNTLDTPEFKGSYTKTLTVTATWYNASHGGKARGDPGYGMTATGVPVNYGICAVDPSVIRLGTRFYVPGYGNCVAADTGSGIGGNHVDLGFPEDAGDPGWGRREVPIYILD